MTMFVSLAAFAINVTYTASDDLTTGDTKTWTPANSLFTFTLAKNTGTTAPAYNNSDPGFRIYAKGSFKIESKNNEKITNVVFNLSSQGKSRLPKITADNGQIAAQAKGDETVSWSGESSSITFTAGDKAIYSSSTDKAGQFCFTTVTITYEDPADAKTTVTLKWANEIDNAVLGQTYELPTLTVDPETARNEITFTSSNKNVADFVEGKLNIFAGGHTNIKAEIKGSETFKDAFVEFELNVTDPNAPKFELVTDVTKLEDGTKIIIVNTAKNKALSTTQNSNNRKAISVTITDNIIEPGEEVQIIELKKDGEKYAFGVTNGYLTSASNTSNYLKTQTDPSWTTISISNNNATIKFTNTSYSKNWIRYNSSSDIFSCYSSGQSDVQIYAEQKIYTAEGAITVEEPYAYQYGNANVLKFAPTIKLNGNAIDDLTELAKFNVVLNGKVLGTAADAINHFAPKQGAENKFTVTKGDQTIEVANVVWPEIDVEPAIEQVEYVKADDGNVHAIYYVAPKTNNSNLHWTVATEHPNSLYWKEGHNGAACQFNNVATWTEGTDEIGSINHPSTFDASISFPFAVKKDSAAQGIRLMANGDEYGIEEYVAAPQSLADDIQNKEFQPNGDKSQTSGVADVAVDQEGEVEFFNLQGVRVNGELTPGLYIRRQGNRATKVVVK